MGASQNCILVRLLGSRRLLPPGKIGIRTALVGAGVEALHREHGAAPRADLSDGLAPRRDIVIRLIVAAAYPLLTEAISRALNRAPRLRYFQRGERAGTRTQDSARKNHVLSWIKHVHVETTASLCR